MKYFKFTMYLDEYEDGEVITNSSEILIEDLTEKQEERLAEAFASLVKDNKAKMDKIVKELRWGFLQNINWIMVGYCMTVETTSPVTPWAEN